MLLSTRPQLLELPTPNASRASLASKTEAELWPPYHLPSLARGQAGQKKERKLAKFTGSGSEPEKHLAWRNMPALAPIILRQPGFGLGSPAFRGPSYTSARQARHLFEPVDRARRAISSTLPMWQSSNPNVAHFDRRCRPSGRQRLNLW